LTSATIGLTRAKIRGAVAVLLVAGVIVGTASPSSARGGSGYAVDLVNQERSWYGSAPLAVDGELQAMAREWAAELAWNGYLAHNPNLWIGGAWTWGENVGYGGSISEVHGAFVNSWHHYMNMVDGAYNRIGVGVAYDDYGGVYVVQVFAAR
jgi:uncharacterized protein YkwD